MNPLRVRKFTFIGLVGIQILGFQLMSSDFAKADGRDPIVVSIEDLHPTQFAVGQRAVEQKVEKISQLSNSELSSYLMKNPAPLVIGPGQQRYITDKHHLASALLRLGIKKMRAQVTEDWSNLRADQFWVKMNANQLVYLFDENGVGPRTPEALPSHIELMKDDPYRSLSGMARDQGCYDKGVAPYAEFAWAQFFRTRVPVGTTDSDFDTALDHALELCHSPAASALPGYSSSSDR